MIKQIQESSKKINNQYNNPLQEYLQLKNQQIQKQPQNSQKIINLEEIKKIIQQNYHCFLQNWNNNKQRVQFQINNISLTCLYSDKQRKQFIAQFLCCTKGCLKSAVICNNQKCQCSQDHKKCTTASIQSFINNLQSKVRNPPNQTFYTYIQAKKTLLNFLVNIISEQRQITYKWQNTFVDSNQQVSQNVTQQKISPNNYYFYEFDGRVKNCKKIKVKDEKNLSVNSQKCNYYELVQFKDKEQRQSKYGNLIKIINKTHNLIIDSFLKQIEKVQQAESRSYYLNYVQYQILKQFMISNGSIDSATSLQEMTGNLVFIAKNLLLKKYMKKIQENNQMKKQKNSKINLDQLQNQTFNLLKQDQAYVHLKMGFDKNLLIFMQQSGQSFKLDKNPLIDLKNKWNQKCSKIFYKSIEGVALQFNQLLKDKFEKPLFPNFKNLPQLVQTKLEKIFLELQGKQICRGKKYQSLQIPSDFISKDILKSFSKVYLQTNLQKIQQTSHQEMSLKISQEILYKFSDNGLKYLNLHLNGIKKFPNGFIQKLCKKFPQLKQFHHYLFSDIQYLQKFQQDRRFIKTQTYQCQLSIEQCLQLSNLKQLQNIFISSIDDKRSADIIKNMKKKSLQHISLYYTNYPYKKICKQLFNQLLEIKQQLITFSLTGLQINQENMQNIMKIIQNNPCLQTLVLDRLLNSSKYIKSQLFQCIGRNLKNLKKLIIEHRSYTYNNNNIQQKDFQMLEQCSSSLKLLDLSWFNKIDKYSFNKIIPKMKNITHLILMGDDFVDDDAMQTIGSSLQKLEVLNLYRSDEITGSGLLKLQNLKYLNTLIFHYNTRIKGQDMIQLSRQVKTIKKLQFSQMITKQNRQNFIPQDLIAIDKNLNQGITHLSIFGCQVVDISCIKNLSSLKVIWISWNYFTNQDKQELQRYTKQKKITLYRQ